MTGRTANCPRLLTVVIVILVGCCGLGVVPGFADELTGAPAALVKQQGLAAGDVGYLLVDLDSGRELASWQADHAFVPGSVLKLATSLVAWQTLGADFHFTTRLWQKDRALYLQGGGDPVLAATDLRDLAQSLSAAHPKSNWQALYVDASALEPALEISEAQPLAADYNPGFGALNVDFNRFVVAWPATPGSRPAPQFRLSSEADGLSVPLDWMHMTSSTDNLPVEASFVLASPGSNQQPEHWAFNPALSRDAFTTAGSFALPVKQADAMTALIFRALALGQHLNLPLPQSGTVPGDATLVAQHDSPSLAEMLPRLLRYSNNLTAELIGLTSTIHLTGKATTLAESAQQQMRWLQTHLPTTDWQGFRMVNQSGLDGDNRATPRQMMAILQRIAADPALASRLPDWRLNDSGSLQQTEVGAAMADGHTLRINGKSGTMDFASGHAGLITTAAGHHLAYVIFMADDRQRAALTATFDPRILQPVKDGRIWTKHAHHLEADLLRHWLSQAP